MKTRQSGFTIVELLFALLMLSVAILALASVMSQTRRMQGLALSRAEVTTVAETAFEGMRSSAAGAKTAPACPGTNCALTLGGSLTSDVASKSDVTTSASGRQYRRRWLVQAGPEGSVQVTLRVLPLSSSRYELSQLDFNTIIFVGE
jgi:prepilin-type N-terminal cleavage/methylation domain-containing protein